MRHDSLPATATPTDRQRGTFLLCAAALLCATVAIVARRAWIEVLFRLVSDGGIAIFWLMSAAGFGAAILRLTKIPCNSKALTFATAAALGLGAMSLATLGLGLCGWLNRPIAIAIVVIGLLAGLRDARNLKINSESLRSIDWLWLVVVPCATLALLGAFVLPGLLWGGEPNGYDVLEYHLQIPREWFELGRIVPLEHNVFSYFPFNIEMHYLLAMHLRGGPWAGMYLAQLMHLIFAALTAVAVYGIVLEKTARPKAAILGAVVCATVPWMGLLGSVAYNEGGLLLFGTLAIGWAMLRTDWKGMCLAGAFAGLACGVKLTAVPIVLVAVPIAMLCLRASIKGVLAFALIGMVLFSPWLIRNFVWTHNPVFPEAMSILGKAHFSDVQVERWQRAHSPREDQRDLISRFQALGSQIIADWRYGLLGLPIEIGAIFLLQKNREARFLAILLGLHLIFWLFFTHLQSRFFVLAIPIGAILIGMVDWPGWRGIVSAGAILSAGVGCIALGRILIGVSPAIGIEDYQPILRELLLSGDVADAIFKSDRNIGLIGDAQAFRYQIPMSRLQYRTVFDVNVNDGKPPENFIHAWSEGSLLPNKVEILFPSELSRFATTYYAIPPFDWNSGTEPAFIFRR